MGRIGAGITLIVVGAILAFAVQADIPGFGEYALGLILMLAGIIVLILHFVLDNQRRNTRTVVEERGPYVARDEVVEEVPVERRVRRRRRTY